MPPCFPRLFLPALLACLPLAAALAPTPARAQDHSADTIQIKLHESATLYVYPGATKVFVAAPAIADVDASQPERIIVYGRAPGTTNIRVTGADGREHSYRVQVIRQLDAIRAAIRLAAPGSSVTLSDTPEGLRVGGTVASPEQAAAVKAVASGFLGGKDTLQFDATIASSVQVLLRVRVAEVSKQASDYLGFNWAAASIGNGFRLGLMTGRAVPLSGSFTANSNSFGSLGLGYTSGSGNDSVASLIDALKEQDLVTILAEPNLTAISGAKASFIAGGEIPVPIVQGTGNSATTSIEWKEFGIKVDFTPTVIDEHRINIKVYSEVSQLSQIGAVTTNGYSIPALTLRKVETTVDMASGQSFAIAGLYNSSGTSSTQGLPFLSEVPILGALFRSRSFQHNQSELVVMITPYVVRPVDTPDALRLPTDGLAFTNEVEQILRGRVMRDAAGEEAGHLRGPSGFMLEDKP